MEDRIWPLTCTCCIRGPYEASSVQSFSEHPRGHGYCLPLFAVLISWYSTFSETEEIHSIYLPVTLQIYYWKIQFLNSKQHVILHCILSKFKIKSWCFQNKKCLHTAGNTGWKSLLLGTKRELGLQEVPSLKLLFLPQEFIIQRLTSVLLWAEISQMFFNQPLFKWQMSKWYWNSALTVLDSDWLSKQLCTPVVSFQRLAA